MIKLKRLTLFMIITIAVLSIGNSHAFYGQSYGYPYSYGLGGYGYPGSIFYPYGNPYLAFYDF